VYPFQEGGSKLQALEMELKAQEKAEAEIVAAHKANHDNIVSEEKKQKQLEKSLHAVRENSALPSLVDVKPDAIKSWLLVSKNRKVITY
jgi:hypothetical protein